MNRRDLLKLALCTVASASISRGLNAGVSTKSEISQATFNDTQRRMISILAELIIPTTDTPGAIDAGVPNFIEVMVSDWYTPIEREVFLAGLSDIDQWCLEQTNLTFATSPHPMQIKALQHMEAIASKHSASSPSLSALASKARDELAPFFIKMKELTVIGYYTSEVGVLNELAYNPAPGYYDGDYDFSEIGRQWAF